MNLYVFSSSRVGSNLLLEHGDDLFKDGVLFLSLGLLFSIGLSLVLKIRDS